MITALFVRRDSVYKSMGVDCFDIDRDARSWVGGTPVICHPPCRAWGRLRHFAKPRPDEKDLAFYSVDLVRKYGGVLEHPAGSTLWLAAQLPRPGSVDEYGGYTICVDQSWFGHKAKKNTFLYIVGCPKRELPSIAYSLDAVQYCVETSNKNSPLRPVTKAEREHTPERFAQFLFDLANRCVPPAAGQWAKPS